MTRFSQVTSLPAWVPEDARHYVWHTESGHSIRALARNAGCHASTVLRQVRRLESRRDCILVDEALTHLGQIYHRAMAAAPEVKAGANDAAKPSAAAQKDICTDEHQINREARRILRRLCESGAVLAVAKDMDKAVVVRTAADNSTTRTATVDRPVAHAMAHKGWMAPKINGRITRYEITSSGRASLKNLLDKYTQELADAQTPFTPRAAQGRDETVRDLPARFGLGESPLVALSRRRDKSGKPFLDDDLVAAGERLREDFELAQIGPDALKNWEDLLHGQVGQQGASLSAPRQRVADALADLGPGLGDVVLRTCCYLEGLEAAEKRMGWAARSGKVVLRIALQRLQRHYAERYGKHGPMIG